jgi:3-phosphoshikimate 1-carboxyvinyltransferase
LLLGALAEGTTRVRGFLRSGDCVATLACVRGLGIEVDELGPDELRVHGRGLAGLAEPQQPLDCATSGTTMRLLAGIIAGSGKMAVLVGGPQLSRRPMRRVAEPLRAMGATVLGRQGGSLPPLAIQGGGLRGIEYRLPVASAQIKSSLLLAGLSADSPTTVLEVGATRDHTERMLRAMGAVLRGQGDGALVVEPIERPLRPVDLLVPADISSAAFLVVAALLVPGSRVELEGVGLNPTRTGLCDVLRAMGGAIEASAEREEGGEPVGDLRVESSSLRAATVGGEDVVRAIDELPVLAVAATQAEGVTVVRDAAELRVKETDRIAAVVEELRKLGARIEARADGFVVEGPTRLRGAEVSSHGDHRLAMALCVAGLVADGETLVRDVGCAADSFPGFERTLAALGARFA